MRMIAKILARPEFESEPPVLIDVGASGGLHKRWKALAKYAVCIAFDADDREMRQPSRPSNRYKRLHIYRRALTAGSEGAANFYLAKSPACSSLLLPRSEKLADWEFAGRFEVIGKTTVRTVHLDTVLRELRIERVDWFKTDSQGTDARLFESLGPQRMRRVLVAEFEPAIMDSYQGEDKLWQVMSLMDRFGFWMSDIEIKGSQRIRKKLLAGFRSFERDYMLHLLRIAPGWAEVNYLNGFSGDDFRLREYLLGWVCATLQGHHGFALELAATAKRRFADAVCEDLERHSRAAIRRCYLNLFAYFPLAGRVIRRWIRQKRHQAAAGPAPDAYPAARETLNGGEALE